MAGVVVAAVEGSSPTGEAMTDADGLCALLDQHRIPYRRFDHPAVFTCDEAIREVPAEADGVQTKNLFLRDGKGRRHWLVITSCERTVDLRALAPVIGADRLTLGSPERLARHLGLTPGAVTVFGLVNDPGHAVEVVVDRTVWAAPHWRCHPLINTATLVVERTGIERFLEVTGHQPRVVEVPTRSL